MIGVGDRSDGIQRIEPVPKVSDSTETSVEADDHAGDLR